MTDTTDTTPEGDSAPDASDSPTTPDAPDASPTPITPDAPVASTPFTFPDAYSRPVQVLQTLTAQVGREQTPEEADAKILTDAFHLLSRLSVASPDNHLTRLLGDYALLDLPDAVDASEAPGIIIHLRNSSRWDDAVDADCAAAFEAVIQGWEAVAPKPGGKAGTGVTRASGPRGATSMLIKYAGSQFTKTSICVGDTYTLARAVNAILHSTRDAYAKLEVPEGQPAFPDFPVKDSAGYKAIQVAIQKVLEGDASGMAEGTRFGFCKPTG